MSVLLLTMGPQLGITADLPVVAVGGAGVIRFRPIGASGPVKWTLVDSTLPAEWDSALNPDGNAVTLTTSDAATAGTFSVTVRAVDSARIPVVRSFEVRVMALPLTISGAFPAWITGLPATGALTISGGVPPYSGLAITSGALPAGVTLALVGNQIVASGTPSVTGPWAATVQVSDAASSLASIMLSSTVFRLWTPADLPTPPKVWLDWDSPITEDAGHASAWGNSNGSIGGSFTQANASYRPEVKLAELSGKRVLRFDGNDALGGAGQILNLFRDRGAGWIFVVAKKYPGDVAATSRRVAVWETDTGSARFGLYWDDAVTGSQNRLVVGGRRLSSDAYSRVMATGTSVDVWSIVTAHAEWTSRVLRLDINGQTNAINPSAFSSAGNTSNTASLQAGIGGVPTDGGAGFMGDIACVIASDTAVTLPDRQRLEGWAAYQCGLQSNLPSNHPYRHTPPLVSP